MKKIIIALLAAIILVGCTNSAHFEKGKKQLHAMGYTDVEDEGYDVFCCGENDDFASGFTARDRFGNEVKGCICSGLLKGVTIRFK